MPFQTAGWTPVEPDALTPDERKRVDAFSQSTLFSPPRAADIKPKPRNRKGPSREEAKESAATAAEAGEDTPSSARKGPSREEVKESAAAGEDAASEAGKEPAVPAPASDSSTATRYFRTPAGELAFFQVQVADPDDAASKDPTLYNRVPEIYVVDDKAPSSSSAGSDRPPVNESSPNPSDILTDFLGQVGGSLRPPRPSPLALAQPPLFEKSNVLLLGPTGVGKSLLARTLARALDVPFVSVEATSMTSSGYVGEDVENCVARLVEAADGDVERAGRGCVHSLSSSSEQEVRLITAAVH